VNISQKVKDFYFYSRDFNGITLSDLYEFAAIDEQAFKKQLETLIRDRSIDMIWEGDIPNQHIKPFPAPEVEKQVEKLNSIDIDQSIKDAEESAQTVGEGETKIVWSIDTIGCCVYPAPEFLQKEVDWQQYSTRPFTLRLAKGEWQLRPYFFELGVLAIYRNDPRYRYQTNDVDGSLYSVEGNNLRPLDKIFLKHFYFGFDEHGTRSVAVLLGDLWHLTPEHQQIWKAKMLPGSYRFKLHPDARKGILGHFPDRCSIFNAFLEELKVINEMALKIKNVPLLKGTFGYDEKPENFGFLILPTLREYEAFCLTLDRMMSDNLNAEFFAGEIDKSDVKNGKTPRDIGNITKLDIWVSKNFRLLDSDPKNQMIKTFRDVRSLRSKPAHSYFSNEWNLNYYEEQRELVNRAYTAIRVLRLILANHPKSQEVNVPDLLFKGEIRTF
jgi:hypothetical protein